MRDHVSHGVCPRPFPPQMNRILPFIFPFFGVFIPVRWPQRNITPASSTTSRHRFPGCRPRRPRPYDNRNWGEAKQPLAREVDPYMASARTMVFCCFFLFYTSTPSTTLPSLGGPMSRATPPPHRLTGAPLSPCGNGPNRRPPPSTQRIKLPSCSARSCRRPRRRGPSRPWFPCAGSGAGRHQSRASSRPSSPDSTRTVLEAGAGGLGRNDDPQRRDA